MIEDGRLPPISLPRRLTSADARTVAALETALPAEEVLLPQTPTALPPLEARYPVSISSSQQRPRSGAETISVERRATMLRASEAVALPGSGAFADVYAEMMSDEINAAAVALRNNFDTTLGNLYARAVAARLRTILVQIRFATAPQARMRSLTQLRELSTGRLFDAAFAYTDALRAAPEHQARTRAYLLRSGAIRREDRAPSLESARRAASAYMATDIVRQYEQVALASAQMQPTLRLCGIAADFSARALREIRSAQTRGRVVFDEGRYARTTFVLRHHEEQAGYFLCGRADRDASGIVDAIDPESLHLVYANNDIGARQRSHESAARAYTDARAEERLGRAVRSLLEGFWHSVQHGVNERGNRAVGEFTMRSVALARGFELRGLPDGATLHALAFLGGPHRFVELVAGLDNR